jgi:hypothetical protein
MPAHCLAAVAARRLNAALATLVALMLCLTVCVGTPAARAADVGDSGVAIVPQDAAFVSATLRLREQYDLIVKSNAFAAIKNLPAVQRAIEAFEEQKLQPGSPLSMLATFMELPENQQAAELLEDMVSSDTFVYGEPSCVTFVELLKKIQQAQQAANILQIARGDASLGGIDIDGFDALDGIEIDELEEDEEEDGEDGASAPRRIPVRPARFQAVDADETISGEELTTRLILQALAENTDLIVVPDIVWGFKTTKLPAAESQLKRIEVLIRLMTQANPDLADSLERRKLKNGEVVTFTIKPDVNLIRDSIPAADDLQDELKKITDRVKQLEIVIALGIFGDRVIFSIGDSADHLDKLATAGSGRQGLLSTKPFAPLMEHKDKKLTAVSHISEPLAKAIAPSVDDIEQLAQLADKIADAADLPEAAAKDAREMLGKMAAGYRKRLPIPGPWTAYSFLAEQGYEGYAWDWSKNVPFDGSKRLELLEHAGGAPLGAIAFRLKTDPSQFEDLVSWVTMGWSIFSKHLLPKADGDAREKIAEVEEHLAPVAEKLVGILRTKILPALADGQIGLVLDAKSRTKRLQSSLPASTEPLPLAEPAIVLGLDDPKLFREGLSDLFALGDELVEAVREINPDAVPADYRLAAPEKTKLDGGSVWSWKMERSGIDDQVRPSIGVGEDVAVLSLLPKQAGRLLAESRLETGSQLSKFEEPLAGAAALDFAGLVDAIQPWSVYLTRYGCVQQRDGEVDRDIELTAEVENEQAKDALKQAAVVCEAMKSLRVAVAETSTTPEATVTHWRNVIRDMPAK